MHHICRRKEANGQDVVCFLCCVPHVRVVSYKYIYPAVVVRVAQNWHTMQGGTCTSTRCRRLISSAGSRFWVPMGRSIKGRDKRINLKKRREKESAPIRVPHTTYRRPGRTAHGILCPYQVYWTYSVECPPQSRPSRLVLRRKSWKKSCDKKRYFF